MTYAVTGGQPESNDVIKHSIQLRQFVVHILYMNIKFRTAVKHFKIQIHMPDPVFYSLHSALSHHLALVPVAKT